MIKKKQIQAGQDPIKNALKGIDLLQLVFFYRQLSKLKSNRESYHIEFVLNHVTLNWLHLKWKKLKNLLLNSSHKAQAKHRNFRIKYLI